MPRKWRHSEKEKQRRRKVLPGFPWEGTFRTKEEIEAYFAGEKIQCLLCGKWYRKVSGSHLSHIHNMTEDEYRQRYGLPWGRGLITEALRKKRSEIVKQFMAEGRIHPFDGRDEEIRQKARETPQRPPQPFARNLSRRHILAVYGRTTPWQREDYETILSRMQEQQRSLRDVCRDPDLPGEYSCKEFVKEHPEFAAKLRQVYFTLPYSIQLKGGKVSPQFRIDCQHLRTQGMTPKNIAKALGVSLIFVRRALSGASLRPKPGPATIQQMQQLAKSRGGKCLSATYINTRTKLLWECEQGHQWTARPSRIKSGQWCPHCAGNVKKTIAEMQQLAERRGGRCLSSTYTNTDTKLVWECKEGHQWTARPADIIRGHWCPHCGKISKRTLEDMRQLAERHGGKCLSTAYINRNTKLVWECAQGHQWEATPSNIRSGRWCQRCARNRRKGTLEEMRQLAKHRGGKCLSKTYINSRTKLLWECAQGHQWEAKPAGIKQGHWCPMCTGNVRGTLEEMQQLAKRRGGKCLSKKYINTNTKFLWECEQGHQWKATPNHIKRGQWCPICARVKQAEAKRLDIEEMRQLAERRGGRCLSSTYTNNKTKLVWQCAQGHQWEATPKNIIRGRWCPSCADKVKITIEEMRQLAKRRGGVCLSKTYINTNTKLVWECEQGHQWKATPSGIKKGYWCPYCAGTAKRTIEDMQRIAERRGGRCLSPTYTNTRTKLLWQCAKGHQWETTPKGIIRGSWCPSCARSKRKETREKKR